MMPILQIRSCDSSRFNLHRATGLHTEPGFELGVTPPPPSNHATTYRLMLTSALLK